MHKSITRVPLFALPFRGSKFQLTDFKGVVWLVINSIQTDGGWMDVIWTVVNAKEGMWLQYWNSNPNMVAWIEFNSESQFSSVKFRGQFWKGRVIMSIQLKGSWIYMHASSWKGNIFWYIVLECDDGKSAFGLVPRNGCFGLVDSRQRPSKIKIMFYLFWFGYPSRFIQPMPVWEWWKMEWKCVCLHKYKSVWWLHYRQNTHNRVSVVLMQSIYWENTIRYSKIVSSCGYNSRVVKVHS